MIIRKAVASDASAITNYLQLAMEDILFEFIGEHNPKSAQAFLLHFVQNINNQYSYQNCFVAEEDLQVIAALNIYDGAHLEQLRAPIANYIKTELKQPFNPEDETQAGEYYIDSFGVSPEHQGQGIGTKLLQYVIDTYVHQQKQTVGLLVDADNPNAKRLYLKLGFKPIGEKLLVGKRMIHLQIKPD
ncbi:GNAT family N-acetyltransferase [Gelidibacter salicanalis]|uniref:GNAT family N-acetyltransferase n=1 Tax=Gelidibacter salicanalis TaxID=291193 RepID=A0A5C7AFT1_9FLAO|nr:GNAT family N-acetyltransferase [Gelidibacter salicanalis]TXE07408.1 GNAT family N-acetyltransferase [Gelidibacter salicanalis]